MRGVALVGAEGRPRKGGPSVPMAGCPIPPGSRKGSGAVLLSRSSAQLLHQKPCKERRRGSPGGTQLQNSSHFSRLSPCEARWQRGERGWTCREALASPATSDGGIERRRGRALCPSQRGCLLSICLPHILSSFLFASHIIAFINRPPRSPIWAFGFSARHG